MDVSVWLQDLGLDRYAQAFREHDVAADVLPELTEADLETLGVSLGDQRRLLKAIASLSSAAVPPVPSQRMQGTPPQLAAKAERRQLTILFCDLVGSTELAARLDPEDLSDVIGAYQHISAEVVARYGGHIARFLGDGVLVYFGYPRAHEDDAERAIHAGLALLESISKVQRQPDAALQARVGIATGLVVVGDLVSERIVDRGTVIGETPNLAARLQALAGACSVFIDTQTRQLLGDLFELSALGSHDLKGFAKPVQVWRVIRERVLGRFEAMRGRNLTPLVGREREADLLLDRWQEAQAGRGQVVMLAGEPGLGKSRLVEILHSKLQSETLARLVYQCSPLHATDPLYPVVRQIEHAAQLSREDSPRRGLAKLRALLALATDQGQKIATLIAAILTVSVGAKETQADSRHEIEIRQVLEGLIGLLVSFAARKPLLLVTEDVQWIDPTSLELLGFVADRIKTLPVMVVITFRPEFIPPWIHSSHATILTLKKLRNKHAVRIAQHVARGKDLPNEILDRIVTKAEGVPLFIEELTKAALESRPSSGKHSTISPWDMDLPATLQGALMERLDHLSSAKEVAQAAAVIGTEFSREALAAITRLADLPLGSALSKLEEAGLIFRRVTAPDTMYVFKHALVRDVAYDTLLKRTRRQLHFRLVDALEAEQPETDRERWKPTHEYGLLAHHCTKAELFEKAVRYRRKAAASKIRRNAYEEAVAEAQQGIRLLENLPAGLERQAEALELQDSLAGALAALKGDKAPATIDAFRVVGELCAEMPLGPQVRKAFFSLFWHHFDRDQWDSARRAAREVLDLARSQDDIGAAALGNLGLGRISLATGDILTARDHFDQVVDLHDNHNAVVDFKGPSLWDVHLSATGSLSLVLLVLGYPAPALAKCRKAVELARQSYWDSAIGDVFSNWCRLQQFLGESEAVLAAATEIESLVDESATGWRVGAAIMQVWALANAGETKLALDRLNPVAERSQEFISGSPYLGALVAQVYAIADRTDEALAIVTDSLRKISNTRGRWFEAELYRLRAEWLLRSPQPNREEAEATLLKALAVARAQRAKMWELRAAVRLARLWGEQGKRHKAYELLAPIYGWFTKDFETLDFKEAKSLLATLQ